MDRRTWQMVRYGILLVVIIIGLVASQRSGDLAEAPPAAPAPIPAPGDDASPARAKTVFANVTIRDLDGNVAYQGDVDVSETLQRIEAGRRLKYRNDGSVFENREKRLPVRPAGHYREWVHPTPALSGPGPQRVVTGSEGEAFYTPDHYRTFERIR